ncbi:MAG: M61 family metallopeptidase [Gammaproteobacteria bacterium]|nr:M61 family metallopeptidase [Gammaproteobacteria bacterium]
MALIHYRIVPVRPEAHLYAVTCSIQRPAPPGQQLWLPAWIPGSYMIRDFARNIVSLTARCEGKPVKVRKLDKQTWRCEPCSGELQIDYEVYAWDLSVRSAHLDTTHGYFNGSSVFVAVTGQEQQACSIEMVRPTGESYQHWRVATTLARQTAALYEFGLYRADNYEELIDHPVELGNFTLHTFDVAGIPHAIAITGRQHADTDRLGRDVKILCETHRRLFGELPPMERYLFQLTVVDNGFGGLEHRSSTSLIASRKSLPATGMTAGSDDYNNLLGLFSHEYFHTWHVKQIKPQEFIPYQLHHEVHTEQLWAFEGITSYYDDLALVRSGMISVEKYLEILAKNITRVLREPGRLKQTLPESSFDAWSKYYKQDENSPNAIVSYYLKGSLFALGLDLLMRRETSQQASLDDVMRRLWIDHGKTQRGVATDSIARIAEQLAGTTVKEYFHQYLYTTEDLPLQALLSYVGVDLLLRPATSDDDNGGKEADKKDYPAVALGGRFSADPAGVRVNVVYDHSALQRAGVAAGDCIVAIDHYRVSKESLRTVITPFRPGDTVTLHLFRRDELMVIPMLLEAPNADTCYLKCQPDSHAKRAAWLHRVA